MYSKFSFIGEEKTHSQNEKIAEFARGTVRFMVGNRSYIADVIIATMATDRSAVLYDLVNISKTEITAAPFTSSSENAFADRKDATANSSIPHPRDGVKFSAQKAIPGHDNHKNRSFETVTFPSMVSNQQVQLQTDTFGFKSWGTVAKQKSINLQPVGG